MHLTFHAESHPIAATARKAPAVKVKPAAKNKAGSEPATVAAPNAKAVAPATAPAPAELPEKKPAVAAAAAPKSAKSAKGTKPVKAAKAPKPEKATKTGSALVRDSFTMPEDDFKRIATLKARALKAQRPAKKSELLRAGLQVLEGLTAAALVEVLNRLVTLKPGRPKKNH